MVPKGSILHAIRVQENLSSLSVYTSLSVCSVEDEDPAPAEKSEHEIDLRKWILLSSVKKWVLLSFDLPTCSLEMKNEEAWTT